VRDATGEGAMEIVTNNNPLMNHNNTITDTRDVITEQLTNKAQIRPLSYIIESRQESLTKRKGRVCLMREPEMMLRVYGSVCRRYQ
jgi:hypothetical protein